MPILFMGKTIDVMNVAMFQILSELLMND